MVVRSKLVVLDIAWLDGGKQSGYIALARNVPDDSGRLGDPVLLVWRHRSDEHLQSVSVPFCRISNVGNLYVNGIVLMPSLVHLWVLLETKLGVIELADDFSGVLVDGDEVSAKVSIHIGSMEGTLVCDYRRGNRSPTKVSVLSQEGFKRLQILGENLIRLCGRDPQDALRRVGIGAAKGIYPEIWGIRPLNGASRIYGSLRAAQAQHEVDIATVLCIGDLDGHASEVESARLGGIERGEGGVGEAQENERFWGGHEGWIEGAGTAGQPTLTLPLPLPLPPLVWIQSAVSMAAVRSCTRRAPPLGPSDH